uniref:Uncharacterized protein n=1 Tax=Cacopsylla melanoneura TaxID=428564 RepID=A0A8D8SQL2_9HEMI
MQYLGILQQDLMICFLKIAILGMLFDDILCFLKINRYIILIKYDIDVCVLWNLRNEGSLRNLYTKNYSSCNVIQGLVSINFKTLNFAFLPVRRRDGSLRKDHKTFLGEPLL